MPPSIGRKFKRARKKSAHASKEVTPDVNTSSPTKNDVFSSLTAEIKFLPKEEKFGRLNNAIKKPLETVCDSEEEMKEFAQILLDSTGGNVDENAAVCPESTSTPLKVPPKVKMVEPASKVDFNPFAFGEGRTLAAARQQKKRKVDSINVCLSKLGNAEQQLLCLYKFLTKHSTAPNANPVVVGAIKAFGHSSTAVNMVQNVKELLTLSFKRRNSNDGRSFVRTILLALAPSDAPDDKTVTKMCRVLGFKERKLFARSLKQAVAARNELITSPDHPLLQQPTHKKRTLFTPAFISLLHDWTLNKCDLVVASPAAKESVLVKDLFTGEKKRAQKHCCVSSAQELHNDLTLPGAQGGFDGARNSEGDVVISDATLRSLLPKQLSRSTDSNKQMCGCEICIISKEFVKTLGAWMNRIGAQQLKDFSSEYEHPRDYVKSMTCPQVNGLSKLHCCLCRCTECPSIQFPSLPTDTPKPEDAKYMSFQCYEYHSYCTVHKSLVGGPTACSLCQETSNSNKENNKNDPVGKLLRKQHLTKKKKLIGEFINDHFLPMTIKCRFHVLHVALLGKHHCIHLRRLMAKETDGSIDTQRDYADALIASFTNEIQSTHFGENASTSMEGVTVRFGVTDFHYHCCASDDKRQDARTTHVNQQHPIEFARNMNGNLLPTKTGVLFEPMDGCAKQCRCSLALHLMSVVAHEKNITVDRMTSAPHHGKGDCDSQGGIDKNHLRRHFRMTAIPETNIGKGRAIEAHTVNEKGKRASMAERMTQILSSEERTSGLKGDMKHKKREANAKTQRRHCHAQHHGNTDTDANAPLKLLNTKFVTTGFPSVAGQKQNGLICHCHFVACPELGVGTVAARRTPCACANCRNTMKRKWENGIAPSQQPRFQRVVDCMYSDVLGTLNDWKTLTIHHNQDNHSQDDLDEVFEDVLGEHEAANSRLIQPNKHGACGAGDEHYIVKWTTDSFSLTEDAINVEGMGGNNLPVGTLVAKGVYWNEVGRAKRWYTPPSRRVQRTFRVRYVVDPDVVMESPSATVVFPNNRRDRKKVLRLNPRRVEEDCHNKIIDESARRARLDYEEGAKVEGVADGDISDDESEGEDESSSDEE